MTRLKLAWPQWKTALFMITSLIGLGISSYLLVKYLSGASVACGLGSGCDVVRLSEYAWVWGVIPRPLLGMVFYIGMIVLAMLRISWDRHDRFYLDEIILLGTVVGVVESGWLFYIQAEVIGAFCVWCLGSGIATVVMFLLALVPFPSLTKRP